MTDMKRKKMLPFLALIPFVIIVLIGIKRIQDKHHKKNNEAFLVDEKVFDIDLSANNSYLKTVFFHGVSFMCPASWDVLKKVSAEGQMYEISCKDNSSSGNRSINFMWMNIEISPDVWIEEGLKEAEEELGSNKAYTSSIKNGMFNTIQSKTVDISYSESDEKVYGKITSFNFDGSSFIVIMFNDTDIEDDVDFYAVEKSFEVR